MEKAVFSEDMREIIKSMTGKMFKSYEGSPERFREPTEFCGNFRVNLGRNSVEFTNYLYETQFPGSIEEVSCFRCERADSKTEFIPYDIGAGFKYMVNERIKSVALVKDIIKVDDGNYEIEFDMAVLVRTTHNVYTFTRDWFYDESLSVIVDPNEGKPFELDKELKQWKNIQDNVEISRRIEEL